jgi:hypothetical protein
VHNAHITHGIGSHSGLVGIETRLQGRRSVVCLLVEGKTSVLFKTSRPALGPAQPVIELVPGLFSEVKWLGREVSHSSPSSAEVKNEWSCTSTPLMPLRRGQGNLQLLHMESVYVLKLSFLRDFRCFTAALPKIQGFWKITPCLLLHCWRRFKETSVRTSAEALHTP